MRRIPVTLAGAAHGLCALNSGDGCTCKTSDREKEKQDQTACKGETTKGTEGKKARTNVRLSSRTAVGLRVAAVMVPAFATASAAPGGLTVAKSTARQDSSLPTRPGQNTQLTFQLARLETVETNTRRDSDTMIEAVVRRDRETIGRLVREGVDVDGWDSGGGAPLHRAAGTGDVDMICYLHRELNADVNVKDKDGRTPLHYAAGEGRRDAVVALLTLGADIDRGDEHRDTALHYAAERGKVEAVVELVRRGANIQQGDMFNVRPLHLAAEHRRLDVLMELLRFNKDAVDVRDGRGWTALHYAARNGHGVLELLESGADVDGQNLVKMTPLQLAASRGQENAVVELLKWKADVNARDNGGWAPLHFVANRSGSVAVAQHLLTAGADITAKDFKGKTPLAMATEKGYRSLEWFLKQWDAKDGSTSCIGD